MYHIFFISAAVDGDFNTFHVLAPTNTTARKREWRRLRPTDFIALDTVPVLELLNHWGSSIFNFERRLSSFTTINLASYVKCKYFFKSKTLEKLTKQENVNNSLYIKELDLLKIPPYHLRYK